MHKPLRGDIVDAFPIILATIPQSEEWCPVGPCMNWTLKFRLDSPSPICLYENCS